MATSNNQKKTDDKWVPSENCQKYMKEALKSIFKCDVSVAYSKFGVSFYINIYEIVARRMGDKFARDKFIISVIVDEVKKEQSNDCYSVIHVKTTLSKNLKGMRDMSAWIENATIEEFPSVRNSIKVFPNIRSMNAHSIYFDKPSDILNQNNAEKMMEANFAEFLENNIAENNFYSFFDVNIIGSSIRVFLRPEKFTAIEGILSYLNKISRNTTEKVKIQCPVTEDIDHGMKTIKLEETEKEKCKSCQVGIKLGQQTINLDPENPDLHNLLNTTLSNRFFDIRNKQKTKQKPSVQEKICQNFEVHLGANHHENDIKKAVKIVANREYPELYLQRIPPIFIPEVFLTKHPEMLDYDQYIIELEKQQQKEKCEKIEEKLKRVRGEYPEKVVYHYLKSCIVDEEAIVIHDHKMMKIEDLEEVALDFEKDFLILNLTKRYVFCLEVKGSCHQISLEKSKQQLDNAKTLIEKWCSELAEENDWKYFSAIYFHEERKKKDFSFCENCAKFIIFGNNFIEQFKLITGGIPAPPKQTEAKAREEFIIMAQHLIFLAAYEPVVTPMKTTEEVVKRVDRAGKLNNIIFWNKLFCFTRKQLPILIGKLPHEMLERVIFLSPASTGKTLALKSKAKQISVAGGKVLFLISSFGWECLLFFQLQHEFQGYNNIKIEWVDSMGCFMSFIKRLKNCDDTHVFVDEADIQQLKDIPQIIGAAKMCKSFWLAVTQIRHIQHSPTAGTTASKVEEKLIEVLKENQFHIVRDELNLPMRNTASIISKAYNIEKEKLSISRPMDVQIGGGDAQYGANQIGSNITYKVSILKDHIDGITPLVITDRSNEFQKFALALKRIERESQVLILIETQTVSPESCNKLTRKLPKGSFHNYNQHSQDDDGKSIQKLDCSIKIYLQVSFSNSC